MSRQFRDRGPGPRSLIIALCILAGTSVAVPSLASTRVVREGTDGPRHVYVEALDHVLVRGASPFDPGTSADVSAVGELRRNLVHVAGSHAEGAALYAVPRGRADEVARALRRTGDAAAPRWAEPALLTDEGVRVHPSPGSLILRLDAGIDAHAWLATASDLVPGMTLAHAFHTPGLLRMEVPPHVDLFTALDRLNRARGVRYASLDLLGFDDALAIPDDPLFDDQWGLRNVGQFGGMPGADVSAVDAWEATRGDSLVLVAVIDQGVDLVHPELAARIASRPPGHDWTFSGPDSTGAPASTGWHGTAVAGIISAEHSNATGIAGLAPASTLLPLRISLGGGSYADRADAIHYASTWMGAYARVVINGSWKIDVDDPSVRIACEDAKAAGCLLVFAAGNDGGAIEYPARYPSTVAVGMTSPCDTRVRDDDPWCDLAGLAGESNVGPELDLVAPGGLIVSTDISGPGGQAAGDLVSGLNGTSYAAPVVSAIAALVWAADPTLDPDQVQAILETTAVDGVGDPAEDTPGFDPFHGHGRVDAFEAVMATGAFRASLAGVVRGATDRLVVGTTTLTAGPSAHVIELGDRPIDAQGVDEVHLSLRVEELRLPAGSRLEIGFVTEAQRARALDDLGDPGALLGHSVVVALDGGGGRAEGGVADGKSGPALPSPLAEGSSLDLVLLPDPDGIGGLARLDVDGVPGTPVSYGVDDWDDEATRLDGENLSVAHVVIQLVTDGMPASVTLSHVRATTHATPDLVPLGATLTVLGDPGSAVAADPGTGAYDLPLDAIRTLDVEVRAEGFLSDTLTVSFPDDAAVTLPIGLLRVPSGALTGTVTAAGVLAEGVEVWVPGVPATTSGASGHYDLLHVPVGLHDVRFRGVGFGPVRVPDVPVDEDGLVVVDADVTAGLDDDLEHGAGYWTHTAGEGGWVDEWRLDDGINHTPGGAHAFVCGTPGGGVAAPGWSALTLPPIRVEGDEVLWIHHRMDLGLAGHTAVNGGRLEARADPADPWTILEPFGGYPDLTAPDHVGPFGSGAGVFAATHDWRAVGFDLSAFAGATVEVRAVLVVTEAVPGVMGWAIDDVSVLTEGATVDVAPAAGPSPVQVGAPWPNPFRTGTTIPFALEETGHVRAAIYDVIGRRVVSLVDGAHEPGDHRLRWDGRDAAGRRVASGVYYLRLESPDGVVSRSLRRLR